MRCTPLPPPAPTEDITHTSPRSFLLSLNLTGLRAATAPQSERVMSRILSTMRLEDSLPSDCLSCHSGPNLCVQPCLPHPEVSCDRLYPLIFRSFSFFLSRLSFPLLSNSDSIAKLQLKILSFPRTYIDHSQKGESLLQSNHNNTLCLNYLLSTNRYLGSLLMIT